MPTYDVNAYQAERLSLALADIHKTTEAYLERMATLLGEALDEERVDGALAADCLADVITDHLSDELSGVIAAVERHYDIKDPTRFTRLSAGLRRAQVAMGAVAMAAE